MARRAAVWAPGLDPLPSGAVLSRGWLLAITGFGLAVLAGLVLSADTYLRLLAGVLLLAVALAAVAIQARHSLFGFAALVVSAVALPIALRPNTPGGRGPNATLLLAAFVVGAWTVTLIQTRARVALREPVVRALVVFLGLAVVAFLLAHLPYFYVPGAPLRAQVGGLGLFLLSGGLFLAVGHRFDVRSLARMTWLFLLAGGAVAAIQAVPPVDALAGRVISSATIGSAFWTWLVAISVSQAVWNRSLSPGVRILLGATAVVALFRGLVLAFSWVSGWLPPLVAVAVLVLCRFPRTTVGAALVAIAPIALVGQSALASFMAGESYSYRTRVEASRVIWDVIQANPWFGLGPANYYWYTTQFPIEGWYVSFSTHNNYLDLVAQVGIIGFLAFCWFIYEVGRLALRLRPRVPSGFAKAYVFGAIAGLAGVLVSGMLADWIIPFAYNVGISGFRSSLLTWVFLGGLLALHRTAAGHHAHEQNR